MQLDDLEFVELTIRRGKRSRDGSLPIYYKGYRNDSEPALCPVRAYAAYGLKKIEGQRIVENEGDWLFPKFLDKQSHVTVRNITDAWKKLCIKRNIPEHHRPEAHSGHNVLLNAAWAFGQSDKQILDISNWSSTRCLPRYIEGTNPNAINIQLSKMSVEEIDQKCKYALK